MHLRTLMDQAVAGVLVVALVCVPLAGNLYAGGPQSEPSGNESLDYWLDQSYLELFSVAESRGFSPGEIREMRQSLKDAREFCVSRFKQRERDLDNQIRQAREELSSRSATLSDAERHDLHCTIQNLEAERAQAKVMAETSIPTAYDNLDAKLDLIEKWPQQDQEIQGQLQSGQYRNRRWADVEDIGFREIAPDQEDDIKAGEEAVQQMRMSGLLPKEVDNEPVVSYVTALARKVADRSDLKVPLHVSVLDSKEINAFALPGGYLFIERGLLEAAADEAELAGVIGHEIGHVTARHGHKLTTRSTIAQILYQSAEIAAAILTGGTIGLAAYYALQYGFYGLGLVLDLRLLGISRDYELQADQLGIQYAWNSGYNPDGFIRFFDQMATTEGYVESTSWFRSHPAFYERMVQARKEIEFLPAKDNLITDSAEFRQMKTELQAVTAKAEQDEADRPSLRAPEQGCTAPTLIEYKAGQPIGAICNRTER